MAQRLRLAAPRYPDGHPLFSEGEHVRIEGVTYRVVTTVRPGVKTSAAHNGKTVQRLDLDVEDFDTVVLVRGDA